MLSAILFCFSNVGIWRTGTGSSYQQSSVRLKRGDSDGLDEDWTCKELDEGLRKRSI